MRQLLILALLCPMLTMCQPLPIKGKVIDEDGTPIGGATVLLKRTGEIKITDTNGTFSFADGKPGDTLIATSIGYQAREVQNNERGLLTIILYSKSVTLEDVIINNGYQSISRERITGSFEKIDNQLLNRSFTPDILSRLEGVSTGTLFTKNYASKELFIHGISTLTAGAFSPLVVLDDFPYEGDLQNINPSNVESITILKDAAAASIWGAKAGNGVIVITTKKSGYNRPLSVSLNVSTSVQGQDDLLKDRNFIAVPDFIEVEKFLFGKGFYNSALSNTTSRPVVSPVVEILSKQRAGQITEAEADGQIRAFFGNDLRRDIMNYLRRDQSRQQYNLAISRGTPVLNYRISAGYDKTLSSFIGDDNQRASLYTIASIKLLSNWDCQTTISYTYRHSRSNGISSLSPGGGKSVMYPYAKLVDDKGNSLPVLKDYRMTFKDTVGGGYLLDWRYRPVDEISLGDDQTISNALLLKLNTSYSFFKGLSIVFNGQLQNDDDRSRVYNSEKTYYTRNLLNRYSQRTATGIQRNIPLGGILDNRFSNTTGYAGRLQLNFNNGVGHSRFDGLAGVEARKTVSKSSNNRAYGYDDDHAIYSNVDYVNSYTLYGNFGNAAIPNYQGYDGATNNFTSVYSNLAWSYQSKYVLTISGRKDASNLFGVNTNNKWAPLWSTGLSWRISDEKFYHLKAISYLRFRLSYGFNGNVNNSLPSQPTLNYNAATPPVNLQYASIATGWNPDLRWEKVKTINAGLDFSTNGNRLNGNIDYYIKNSMDLVAPVPVDPTLGMPGDQVRMNSASLSGQGMDLKINSTLIDRVIKWDATIVFNYNTNKVTNYLLESANKGSKTGYGYFITPIVGKDPYSLISYKWAGLDPQNGDPRGLLSDTITKNYFALLNTNKWDDMVFTGSTRPPFFGNIITSISWKSVSASVNIGYRFGYYFRRGTLSYGTFFNNWSGHEDYYHRWQQPGDELFTTVPSMQYPVNSSRDQFYQYSEATVEKGDHIRLQDLRFNWELLNNRDKKKSWFKKLSLSAYLSNLGIIWAANGRGYDPDYGNEIPPSKAYTLAVNIDF